MPILKTIQTTSAQILDANGANGFGTVTVRASQPFTYDDGVSTITVADTPTIVNVADGLLASSFSLQPNTGASNNPDKTYYIVDIAVNGLPSERIYWQIASADSSPIEFSSVPRLPAGESSEINDLKNEANPFDQYVLRSDASETKVVGAASDGKGYVVRTNTSGIIDADMITDVTDVPAASIAITDAGGYYTGTEVETALQEVGADITSLESTSNSGGGSYLASASPSLGTGYTTVTTCTGMTLTGFYAITVSFDYSATGAVLDFRTTLSGPTFANTIGQPQHILHGSGTTHTFSYTFYCDVTAAATINLRMEAGASVSPTISNITIVYQRLGDT